jgi:aminopeptidase YwaD
VDTLTSPYFWGRGYTKDGMKKAASFLADQFKELGLQPLDGKSFLQSFTYSANTFPGKMEVEINDKKLIPGVDFIVGPESRGIKAKGKLKQSDSTHFVDAADRIIVSFENETYMVCRAKRSRLHFGAGR